MRSRKIVAMVLACSFSFLASPLVSAQSAARKTAATEKRGIDAPTTARELKELRQALAAQQEQLQKQQQQIQALLDQMQKREESTRRADEAARQAQVSASEAASKVNALESSIAKADTEAGKTQSDIADVKLNQQNAAVSTQEDQKRVAAVEGVINRFRLSGDVRVRGESFIQTYDGCGAACNDRHRARIRVRLGIDGKLNENFIGGIALATGSVVNGAPDFKDPVSTNETLTSYFERKTIGLDRGYITFNPQRAKWISLTGGKWAYSWNRTPMTFDNDLNPDGFNEKLNFDLHGPILKNFNAQAIQLLFNEVSGATDSNAVGASFSGRLQLGRFITLTPTYTLLNWNGADAIAQAASPVTLPNPNTPAVGTPLPNPTSQPVRIINANAFTNASKIVGTGTGQKRAFVSGFESSEFLLDMNVLTPFKRYPVRVFGNYVKNLRARVSGDTAFWAEGSVGQQKQRNDLLVGYSYAEIEQDALISQFNESDMRAATNVLQHRFYLSWLMMPNTTLAFTLWHGHTMDTTLQNAARAPGIPVGGKDPYLNRLQLEVIYKF